MDNKGIGIACADERIKIGRYEGRGGSVDQVSDEDIRVEEDIQVPLKKQQRNKTNEGGSKETAPALAEESSKKKAITEDEDIVDEHQDPIGPIRIGSAEKMTLNSKAKAPTVVEKKQVSLAECSIAT